MYFTIIKNLQNSIYQTKLSFRTFYELSQLSDSDLLDLGLERKDIIPLAFLNQNKQV